MSETFNDFARYYDDLYRDKDYEAECDRLEELLAAYADGPVDRLLDCACGTGGHAVPMAERGYAVTGFDVSERMIEVAREKAADCDADLALQVADLRSFEFDRTFDAAVCLFASMGYLTGDEEILSALRRVRSHLSPGAPFLVEFWNGLAVVSEGPESRVKTVRDDGRLLVRTVDPDPDWFEHVNRSHYDLYVVEDGELVAELAETHDMRFFFPREIEQLLDHAGFQLRGLRPALEEPPDSTVDRELWNLMAIAEAV